MRLAFILGFSLIFAIGHTQKPKPFGIYTTGELTDTLVINQSNVSFKYENAYGTGTYKMKKDKILVRTKYLRPTSLPSFKIIGQSDTNTQVIISVINPPEMYPVTTFFDIRKNSKRKYKTSFMIDDSNAFIRDFNYKKPENFLMSISNNQDRIIIPLNKILGKSIKIFLTDRSLIVDRRLYFNVIKDCRLPIFSTIQK
jgi:hypothetical protein